MTPKATADTPVAAAPSTEASPEALATAQAMLDAQLVTLYTSPPARTTVAIFTDHSDPRRKASVNARKVAAIKIWKKAEEMDRSVWCTASDVRALEKDVWKVERGSLILGSSRPICRDRLR